MTSPGDHLIQPNIGALGDAARPPQPFVAQIRTSAPLSGDFDGGTRLEVSHDGKHWGPLQGHVAAQQPRERAIRCNCGRQTWNLRFCDRCLAADIEAAV